MIFLIIPYLNIIDRYKMIILIDLIQITLLITFLVFTYRTFYDFHSPLYGLSFK